MASRRNVSPTSVPVASTRRLTDEMFRRQRTAVLGDNLETWFVWDKKDEASGFSIGLSFAEPTVTQLTTKCYQKEPPR
jgi:hypothetical protein